MRVKTNDKHIDPALVDRLAEGGFRPTPQREHVYNVLIGNRDHPTAEQVFLRAKAEMPEISMATVYNCLDALVKCKLVREVNVSRGATRYCSNMTKHWHFYCDECGNAYDIDFSSEARPGFELPKGFEVTEYDLSARGLCSECAGKERK